MTELLITSSVLITAIVLVRAALKNRVSARLIYALWLVAALRLMLPFELYPSQVSVMNAAPDAVLMVSANLVMALRFALLAQGMGVLSWFLEEKNVGALGRTLAAVAGLYLEAQFIVVSIVGLVDVWANFRHLVRGGQPGPTGNAEQDKEPANAG